MWDNRIPRIVSGMTMTGKYMVTSKVRELPTITGHCEVFAPSAFAARVAFRKAFPGVTPTMLRAKLVKRATCECGWFGDIDHDNHPEAHLAWEQD